MATAYSDDLRRKLLEAHQRKEGSLAQLAERFSVGLGWALKISSQLVTLLGAVSVSGWVATMTIESPTDGDVFLAYLEQVLCPRLRTGHCVVMDNLAAHKVKGVRQLIEATGARLLYLPRYSPDFNPIEKCWAQLKQIPARRQGAFCFCSGASHHFRPLPPHRRPSHRLLSPLRICSTETVKML
jgi:transposase